MKIILSPAKKMRIDNDDIRPDSLPVFLDRTEEVLNWLKEQDYDHLKKLWECSDKIAQANYERLMNMDLHDPGKLTPAVLAYDGIAFQYMAPEVFTDDQFQYASEHVRILSGFYGVLKPMDGVVPYRLEMQAKAGIHDTKDLYEYWGDSICQGIRDDVIVNLASKEYSICVERYLKPSDTFITCIFGQYQNNKIIQKGVYAKMARGDMARYMAEKNITDLEQIKTYSGLGYHYVPELSNEREYVFIKK